MIRSRLPAPDGRVRVVPSLLAADFGDLAGAVRAAEAAGAEWISVDVMDGRFVPNLSFGPDHVRALRPGTRLTLDAHLMVADPQRFAPLFARAGADAILAHIEACPRPRALLRQIRRIGAAAGLALRPATPAAALAPYLAEVDVALVMMVEPGFGGRSFRKDMLPKVRELRRAVDRSGLDVWIMVDGGVGPGTAAEAAGAGADALVAGTSFFRAKDPAGAFRGMSREAQAAFDGREAKTWRSSSGCRG